MDDQNQRKRVDDEIRPFLTQADAGELDQKGFNDWARKNERWVTASTWNAVINHSQSQLNQRQNNINRFQLLSTAQQSMANAQQSTRVAIDQGNLAYLQPQQVMSPEGKMKAFETEQYAQQYMAIPNNSATQMMRDKLSEAVKEFDAILKPLQSARIIYLGTPQCEMSLYNRLPERGYEIRVWPALYPTLQKVPHYKGSLAPFITQAMEADPTLSGKPTDPRRFDEKDLMERMKHSQQKEQRIIDTLEPVLTQHRLIVDQKLIERDFESAQADIKYSLFYQLTRLTRDRGALSHDDRLDALAMAVAYWVDHMARDNDKAVQEMRTKNMDAELKKFMGHVLGRPQRAKGWMGGNAGAR